MRMRSRDFRGASSLSPQVAALLFSGCFSSALGLATRKKESKASTDASTAQGAEHNPNARGYFVLTRFRTWRPGEMVHLACPGAPLAAVIAGGVIIAFVGAVVGYFLAAETSKFGELWHACGAAALV